MLRCGISSSPQMGDGGEVRHPIPSMIPGPLSPASASVTRPELWERPFCPGRPLSHPLVLTLTSWWRCSCLASCPRRVASVLPPLPLGLLVPMAMSPLTSKVGFFFFIFWRGEPLAPARGRRSMIYFAFFLFFFLPAIPQVLTLSSWGWGHPQRSWREMYGTHWLLPRLSSQ